MTERRRGGRIGNGVIGLATLVLAALLASGLGLVDHVWSIWLVYYLYAVMGGLLLRHDTRNPIGLFLIVMGLIPLFGNLAEAALMRHLGLGLLHDLATWIAGWYFLAFFGAFVPLFHVFPTGSPLSGWWRWWYRLALAASTTILVLGMFTSVDESVVNPFAVGVVSAMAPVLGGFAVGGLAVGLVTALLSLFVRFRRARLAERLQMKWFFASVLTAVFMFAVPGLLSDALGILPSGVAESFAQLAFPLPAVGVFLAVTRHGLYDIDRIVSRTVTYAVVATVLVAVYAIPVLILPEVLGLSGDITVAGATLLAAAVFDPLRRRVSRVVGRRFNRSRYDADRVVSSFSEALRSAIDVPALTSSLGAAIDATLRPASLAVWFSEANS